MPVDHPKAFGLLTALLFLLTPQVATAQESKTLSGRVIGTAEWQDISPGTSEFDITSSQRFMVRKKEFPQRYQEEWLDTRSSRSGARLHVFYERSNRGGFSTGSFERDFERLVEVVAERYGTDEDDIRYEKLNRAFRLAYQPHGNAHCAMGMRIFGVPTTGRTSSGGDRYIRISVCKLGDPDDQMLKAAVIATAGAMKQDGREPKLIGLNATAYDTQTEKIFGQSAAPRRAPARETVGWDRQKIKIDWDGNPELKTGTIFLRDDQTRGRILITVDGAFKQCNGNYNMDIGRAGAWNITCTDGRKATGTFQDATDGSVSGKGTDDRGAAIHFTMAKS